MKSNKKKKYIIIFGIILLVSVISFGLYIYFSNDIDDKVETKKIDLEVVKSSYNDYVSLNDGSSLYVKDKDKYKKVSNVVGNIEISLDKEYEIVDEYIKLLDSDYYVRYDSFSKIDSLSSLVGEHKYYENYIPYNEDVVLNTNAKLYVDDNNYYVVDNGEYDIIIKDSDRYGIEYNNRLVYVNSDDVKEVVSSDNTDEEISEGVSVLNYHFVVSASNENNELSECRQSICITDTLFDSHIKYLYDNGYYGVSIRDLELFIDGKIQLPKNSVSITIDDGWYVYRSIFILEKYEMLGTLFLIGSLASPDAYKSSYLEVHSHTWNMHGLKTGDDCPNTGYRGGITCFDDDVILEDLRKSRESLGNTTYFCYPFYDYTDKSIKLLKEAGFTMAFAGLPSGKVRVGSDKYRIPRYVVDKNTTLDKFISYVS